MFICKQCGRNKRNLTPKDNKCKFCGSERFTTKAMEQLARIMPKVLDKVDFR